MAFLMCGATHGDNSTRSKLAPTIVVRKGFGHDG